ncbi:MAG: hypothetical protein ACHQZR_06670 [Candidatus Limnocylindrales bacterium]
MRAALLLPGGAPFRFGQALLDEADLHEMDQADHYGDTGKMETPAPEPRRSPLDRLLRR